MEYRKLGRSGLKVPALSLGTATFGGVGSFFEKWGSTQDTEAQRIVDVSLDHGFNFFDTADIYSNGRSEEILGAALKGKRDCALISTKSTFSMGAGPNEVGSSRHHLVRVWLAANEMVPRPLAGRSPMLTTYLLYRNGESSEVLSRFIERAQAIESPEITPSLPFEPDTQEGIEPCP